MAKRSLTLPDPDARLEAAELPRQAVLQAPALTGRHRPGRPRHEPIDPDLLDDLRAAIGDGLALLECPEDAATDGLIDALGRYVDAARADRRRLPKDEGRARLALACLYGQLIARAHGWGFAHVRCVRKPGILVVSPDRRYAAAPRAVVEQAFELGGARLAEHFRSLADPRMLPPSAPGKYLRLDAGTLARGASAEDD